jgi:DNA modification methylase
MKKLEIKYLPIEGIKPYEKNPRKNKKAVEIVKKSIKAFGFKNPIIIDKDNVIIAGHTRLEASKELDYKEVPIIYAEDLTPEQVNAFRIMDNKSQEYAAWDYELLQEELKSLKDVNFDLDLTGFTEANLNRIMKAEPERLEGGKKAKYQLEPGIYKLGENYLILGDCTKIDYEKLLKGQKIQLIYTDPPYGVSYSGHKSEVTQEKVGMRMGKDWDVIEGDNLRGDELYELLEASFKQIEPFLSQDAGAYVFHASRNQGIFEKALNKTGWEVKQQLIWKKPSVLSHAHYHWAHEPIFYCGRKGKPIKFYGDRMNKTVLDDLKIDQITPEEALKILKKIQKQSTVLEFKKDNTMNYIHPTQKPVNMAEYFITNNTKVGDWVIDMFAGSGSTLLACKKTKRRCITSELDPKYASHIIERYEELGEKWEKID